MAYTFLSADPVLVHNLFGTGLEIRWYGVMIALGVLCALASAMWITKKRGISTDLPIDAAIVGVLTAVVFARIYYVLFDTTGSFWRDPLSILYIWKGGLAIYGGIIGAFLALWIFSRRKKISLLFLADLGAPALALGQAFGRWGNYFNQEAFGLPVTNPHWQWFPFAVYIENPNVTGYTQPGWFNATFFYESLWCLLLFAFLFAYVLRGKQKFLGEITLLYFVLYGIERAGVELLRTDQLWIPGTNIPISHVVSLILVAVCGVLLVINYRRYKAGKLPPFGEVLAGMQAASQAAYPGKCDNKAVANNPPDEEKPQTKDSNT